MVLCGDMRSLCLPSIPPASYRLCGCLAIGDSYEKSRNKNMRCKSSILIEFSRANKRYSQVGCIGSPPPCRGENGSADFSKNINKFKCLKLVIYSLLRAISCVGVSI